MVSILQFYFGRRIRKMFPVVIIVFIWLIYSYIIRSENFFSSTLDIDTAEVPYTEKLSSFQWCEANPFLKGYDQKLATVLEKKWRLWNQNHLSRTFRFLKKYLKSPTQALEKFVQIVYPSAQLVPCPYNEKMKRYGTSRDSGKFLCGLEMLLANDSCIVYSLGSNNLFDFEESVLLHTHCTIYTFDCTSSPPTQSNNRLNFHKICLGETSPLQNFIYPNSDHQIISKSWSEGENEKYAQVEPPKIYMTFDEILKQQKHKTVHVLKMDIEGGEYSVFVDLLKKSNRKNLPYQISFESHWWNQDIYHAYLHMSLFSQLWTSGYRLLWYEFNENDRTCIEWTFIRMFC